MTAEINKVELIHIYHESSLNFILAIMAFMGILVRARAPHIGTRSSLSSFHQFIEYKT